MAIEPIRPEDVDSVHRATIPDEVFAAFNELIIKNMQGLTAIVKQDQLEALLKTKGISRSQIHDNRWLDVEPHYRKVGWVVEYDKPGYNESYVANFRFTVPSKR